MKTVILKKYLALTFALIFCLGAFSFNIGFFKHKANEEAARFEKRKITQFPRGKRMLMRKDFYKEFENWYRDRMWGRRKFIQYWGETMYKLHISIKTHIFFGKEGWLFSKSETLNDFKDIDIKMQRIKEIQDYCEGNGVKFVFIIAPYKNSIYFEYIPKWFRKKYKDRGNIETEIVHSTKKYGVNYVDLYHLLINSKDKFSQPLYWKDDHHWNYNGMSIVADKMLKYFQSVGFNVKYDNMPFDRILHKAPKSNSHIHALGIQKNYMTEDMALWSKKFTEEIYLQTTDKTGKYGKEDSFKGKEKYPYTYIEQHKGEMLITNKITSNNLKVMILGNSMSGYMTMYLSQYISKIIGTHFYECHGIKKNVDMKYLLNRYKPDIAVLQISEPSFNCVKADCFSRIKL